MSGGDCLLGEIATGSSADLALVRLIESEALIWRPPVTL
jgi:hypothetical protein